MKQNFKKVVALALIGSFTLTSLSYSANAEETHSQGTSVSTSTTDGSGSSYSYSYDENGNLIGSSSSTPQGTSSSTSSGTSASNGTSTSYAYDENGNVIGVSTASSNGDGTGSSSSSSSGSGTGTSTTNTSTSKAYIALTKIFSKSKKSKGKTYKVNGDITFAANNDNFTTTIQVKQGIIKSSKVQIAYYNGKKYGSYKNMSKVKNLPKAPDEYSSVVAYTKNISSTSCTKFKVKTKIKVKVKKKYITITDTSEYSKLNTTTSNSKTPTSNDDGTISQGDVVIGSPEYTKAASSISPGEGDIVASQQYTKEFKYTVSLSPEAAAKKNKSWAKAYMGKTSVQGVVKKDGNLELTYTFTPPSSTWSYSPYLMDDYYSLIPLTDEEYRCDSSDTGTVWFTNDTKSLPSKYKKTDKPISVKYVYPANSIKGKLHFYTYVTVDGSDKGYMNIIETEFDTTALVNMYNENK